MEYNQKQKDAAGDQWVVQLSSASLRLPSYYKFSQVWLKKKLTSNLNFTLKFWL